MLYLVKNMVNDIDGFRYYIDSPKDRVLHADKMLVRGWAFPTNPDQKLTILIKEDGAQKEFPFNELRPDVANYFKGKYSVNQLCGFYIVLSGISSFELIIKSSDRTTCVFNFNRIAKSDENFFIELNALIESFGRGGYKIEKFKPAQINQLSEIYDWQEKQDIKSIADYASHIINDNEFSLPHPLKPEIKTFAKYSSIHNSGVNYIVFSDIELKNLWCLAQEENFIDAIIMDGLAFEFSTKKAWLVNNFVNMEYPAQSISQARNKITFSLHHSRPYHFFYDYLKHLNYIISTNKLISPPAVYAQSPFLPLELFGDRITICQEKPELLISPTLVATNRVRRSTGEGNTALGNSKMYKEITQSIESIISYPFEDKSLFREDFDLKIWVGISAEKRKWIEQVQGYAQIITALSRSFNNILVIADGLTAPYGKKIKNTPDAGIFEEIKSLSKNERTHFHSLIGEDYTTKIKYCKHVDFFISDAGTGCVVPLRLCKKPGVLFSNKTLFTFPDDYPDSIRIVSKCYVTDIDADNKTADFISYSIDWRHIYKEVCTLICMITKYSELNSLPESKDGVFNLPADKQ